LCFVWLEELGDALHQAAQGIKVQVIGTAEAVQDLGLGDSGL